MKLRYLPLLALALPACTSPDTKTTNQAATAADARFDRYKDQFILDFWRQNPDYASSQGFHKYDSLLVVPDANQRRSDAAFVTKNLGALAGFTLDSLSPTNQIDWRLLSNELRSQRWYADTLRSWQWNPATYNLGASVGDLLRGGQGQYNGAYPRARRPGRTAKRRRPGRVWPRAGRLGAEIEPKRRRKAATNPAYCGRAESGAGLH
jgi:hypothetical protein